MQTRMPTRRCAQGKVPCQQIPNLFATKDLHYLKNMLPQRILKHLPSTQKISCELIQNQVKLSPMISNEQALKEIRKNSRLLYERITQLIQQKQEKNNIVSDAKLKQQNEVENQIKFFQSPPRKVVKRDDYTQSVSASNPEPFQAQSIFLDEKVMDKLQDYLSME